MSSTQQEIGTTSFVTVGGTAIPLPPNARPDIAYLADLPMLSHGINNAVYINTTADYLILLSFTILFVSNLVAGDRTFFVQLVSDNFATTNNSVWLMPTGITLAANQIIEAAYTAGLASAYAASGTDFTGQVRYFGGVPIPPGVMLPGWALIPSGVGPSVDSANPVGVLQVIRIPSGPDARDERSVAPLPVPVLL